MRIIFAGGGTGGHLFPGIALAQELLSSKKSSKEEMLFLCTDREFDRKQLERYQFNYHVLPSPRLPSWKNPFAVVKFAVRMFITLFYTRGYFKKLNPQVIVGLGGYGSFSSVIWAWLKGIPFLQLEQNVLPGRVTRFLCRYSRFVFCQWDGSVERLKKKLPTKSLTQVGNRLKVTGSPIRQEILESTKLDKSQVRKKLGLTKEYVLLIVGGSQGAESLNNGIVKSIDGFKKLSNRLSLIHLTGHISDIEDIQRKYRQAGIEAMVQEFSGDMGALYAASDFVISRAGGIAIAEMAVFGLPMILIPLPTAADNHQYFNALEVQNDGAGILVAQSEMAQKIVPAVEKLLSSAKQLPLKYSKFSQKDAAKVILDELSSLLSPK